MYAYKFILVVSICDEEKLPLGKEVDVISGGKSGSVGQTGKHYRGHLRTAQKRIQFFVTIIFVRRRLR